MDFPIFKTKIKGEQKKFNLNDPKEQREYFELKAGKEIKKLQNYLKKNTFIAYLLGKKNSGKGTYTKMFAQLVAPDRVDHFSVGDMTREIDRVLKNKKAKKELINFLKNDYRGWQSLEEIILKLEKRNTENLLPTELILALIKREILKKEKKSLFIDGFPRGLDQLSFSLFFRDLAGYRDDPDIFILIDVPDSVLDERMKWRRVCPLCQTSRNFKLLPTSKVAYDDKKKRFYLLCDNPRCQEVEMLPKEGDELGINSIKERLKIDEKLMKQTISLYGIPKIFLRNTVPIDISEEYIDDYEITPEYVFEWDKNTKKVNVKEKPWIVLDENKVKSYSLLAPPVVVSLIKQMNKILNL